MPRPTVDVNGEEYQQLLRQRALCKTYGRYYPLMKQVEAAITRLEKKNADDYTLDDLHDIAAAREAFAWVQTKYNPGQPRVPAGSPGGGQWTDGSGGAGATAQTFSPQGGFILASDKVSAQYPAQPYVANDKNPPVPVYKKDIVQKADWQEFNAHYNDAKKMPDVSDTEKFAARETFAAEGGMMVSSDKSVTAIAGINKAYLRDLKTQAQAYTDAKEELAGIESNNGFHEGKKVSAAHISKLKSDIEKYRGGQVLLDKIGHDIGTPANPLTPKAVADIYHYDFNRRLHGVGGVSALEKLGNPYAAAALTDTLFRHGQADGAQIVLDAVNTTRRSLGQPPVTVIKEKDKPLILGPKIFKAYFELAGKPATLKTLLGNLADLRYKAAGKTQKAEKPRFDRFGFEQELESEREL